jgi:predicted RNA-binding protein with PUA-like domain
MKRYWLVKSEPEVYGISQLKRDVRTQWTGVRNYQARNLLMEMKTGELVIFYHSNAKPPAAVGVAKVFKEAYPDSSQFERRSEYFDPKSTSDKPRWFAPDLEFVSSFVTPVALESMRSVKGLAKLPLLQRGSRLSVNPVTESEFNIILKLGCVSI